VHSTPSNNGDGKTVGVDGFGADRFCTSAQPGAEDLTPQQITELRAASIAARESGRELRRAKADYEAALHHFQNAQSLAQRAGDSKLAAEVMVGAVDCLNKLGRSKEADALADHLDAEYNRLGMAIEAAKLDVNRGIGLLEMRRCEQAHDLFARALPCLMREGEPYAQAFVQNNLATALTQLGRLKEAMVLLDDAYSTFGSIGQDISAMKVLVNKGYIHYVRGGYADAIALLRKTRGFLEDLRGTRLEGHSEEVLAHCNADLADVQREANLREDSGASYDAAIACYAALFRSCGHGRRLTEHAYWRTWDDWMMPRGHLRSRERHAPSTAPASSWAWFNSCAHTSRGPGTIPRTLPGMLRMRHVCSLTLVSVRGAHTLVLSSPTWSYVGAGTQYGRWPKLLRMRHEWASTH
jgi:tetratricopeptide (TPR) repeat protein